MKPAAIIIIVFNLDKFIGKQITLFRYMNIHRSNTDIIVVNNSTDDVMRKSILSKCKTQMDYYIETACTDGDNSFSHAFALNTAFQKFKDSYERIFFVDHDIFPLNAFSIMVETENIKAAGVEQVREKDGFRVKYFFPGCLMLNMLKVDKSIIDFTPDGQLGVDTGGKLYPIIHNSKEHEYAFFNEVHHQNSQINKNQYNFYSIITTPHESKFMHFINASNWAKNDEQDHDERLESLNNILNRKINGLKT